MQLARHALSAWLALILGGAAAPATCGGIAWHGTWAGALREAQRTARPILLISAAPHCHQVPGIW